MIDITIAQIGDKVHYQPDYNKELDIFENGIIKEIPSNEGSLFDACVRVVYHCNNDWDNYKDYTSALTNIRDLYPGFKAKS